MMKYTPVTAEHIDVLVPEFYARIRAHEELGPIFIAAIGTSDEAWRVHEAKIASFWRNANGLDKSYSGNPMIVHGSNRAIHPEHFPIWLDLFRRTAAELLPPKPAAAIAELADRIGQGLSFGITQFRQRADAPPDLRG